MATMSAEQARHVADNPDGVGVEDLEAFLSFVGEGASPVCQAASIWPNEEVDQIPNYNHSLLSPVNRVRVLVILRDYCELIAKARRLRIDGQVHRAISIEHTCEALYHVLPKWAKW